MVYSFKQEKTNHAECTFCFDKKGLSENIWEPLYGAFVKKFIQTQSIRMHECHIELK